MFLGNSDHYTQQLIDTLQVAANELSVLQAIGQLKPKMQIVGDIYLFTYGEDNTNCICGAGYTPMAAMEDFYASLRQERETKPPV